MKRFMMIVLAALPWIGTAEAQVRITPALYINGSGTARGTVTIPSGSNLVMNATTLSEADLAKIDAITNGTGAAGKALVLDANADVTAGLRALTATYNALGTTTTAGFTLQNTTAAAAGAQQYSPGMSQIGRGWETNVGSSMPVETRWQVRPVQGAAAPTFNYVLMGRVNEGAWSDLHTVTSAGSFGIGTTGPDGTLHVHRASAGSVTAHPNADELIVENSGDAGLSLLTPDANVGYVAFGSPTDNFGAWLRWKHDDNDLQLGTSKTGGFISLLTGNGEAAVRITTGGNFGVGTTAAPEKISQGTANGATWGYGQVSELLTLSTGGTTTDTTANLLPANSIIEAVVARVTTTITTATSWQLGDASTAGRFTAANSTMTAGTTGVGLVHVDVSGAGGPRQTAAAKVRVTTVGTPGAGAIRITVFYRTLVPPTS